MFCFFSFYFQLVGLHSIVDVLEYNFFLLSRNWYGSTPAGYRNEKFATDHALSGMF